MNKFFNMIAKGSTCSILLYGDIGERDKVRSGDIARELLEAEAMYKNIDVRINSYGGDVYSGIAIFNALRNSKANINVYIDGVAASMASVIAMCGKPVKMSKYAKLMLHNVSGGCYGNKKEMQKCINEIETLEDTLCQMYSAKTKQDKEAIKAKYFDGEDHWMNADEALALGFVDGIYDAEPVPEDATAEQVYQIFNNRLVEPQNSNNMNIEELKKRPQFKDCATDEDVIARIAQLESEAATAKNLTTENARLKGEVKTFKDKEAAATDAANKALLDAAEKDGRIDAKTRPMYENLLKSDPENCKGILATLQPKRMVMQDLNIQPEHESPWDKRMKEIEAKCKH